MKKLNENNIKLKQIMREVDGFINDDFIDNMIMGDMATLAKSKAKFKGTYGGVEKKTNKAGETETYKITVVPEVTIPAGEWADEETKINKNWIGNIDFESSTIDGHAALIVHGNKWRKIDDKLVIAFTNQSSGDEWKEDTDITTWIYYWKEGKRWEENQKVKDWGNDFDIQVRKKS